jgi:hypothetical protein
MLCLTPIILIGAMLPISTDWHTSQLDHSPMLELHTCNTGLGLHARAARNGLYTAGVDYGFTREYKGFEFSVMPQTGLSYVDHPSANLPARTQYELGVQAMVCYDHYCSALGYLHMSNGRALGMCWSGEQCRPNRGEDMITVLVGMRFNYEYE